MIVSSARAWDRRSLRSAFGFSLRPKIDSGNRLRRAMCPSVGWICIDVRHGAYQWIVLFFGGFELLQSLVLLSPSSATQHWRPELRQSFVHTRKSPGKFSPGLSFQL